MLGRSGSCIATSVLAVALLCGGGFAYAQTLVNINTADEAALDALPGVGPVIAQRIVEYRQTHGPFASIEDIKNVSGIGETTFANMEHMITVSGASTIDDPQDEETEVETSTQKTVLTEEKSATGSSSSRSDHDRVVRAFESDTALSIDVRGPARAYVNRVVNFSVTPTGLSPSELMTMRYIWNFGDGTISETRTPKHTYRAPGNYKVVVRVLRAGHESVGDMAVTVLPLTVSLAWTADGELLLHNDSRYEIDVSGITVAHGDGTFVLPDDSYLLPNASIMLPSAVTQFQGSHTFVQAYDAGGELLAQYPPVSDELHVASAAPRSPTTQISNMPTKPSEGKVSEEVVRQAPESTETTSHIAGVTSGAAVATAQPFSRRALVPYIFMAVLAMALLALYAHKLV